LEEIAEEQLKGDVENAQHEDRNDETGTVLVTCKDERSCLHLQECISKGPHQVTVKILNIVLYSHVE
jgi:DNA excision repair protein ERCC-4